MDRTRTRNQQESLLDSARKDSGWRRWPYSGQTRQSLKEFCEYSDDDVRRCLSDKHLGLKRFFFEVRDHGHPDVYDWFDGFKMGTFLKEACDAIDVINYISNTSNNPVLIDQIKKTIRLHSGFGTAGSFDAPSRNLNQTRFLPDHRLVLARSFKDSQEVYLRVMYGRGREAFDSQPDDLSTFARFTKRFEEEIKLAEERREHFEKHGLTSMVEIIQETISTLKKRDEEAYHGFHSVSMTVAASILSKMSGAEWVDNRIRMPSVQWASSKNEYKPVVHPWHVVEPYATDEMKAVIDRLDHAPELYDKALFDHFWVLLPNFYEVDNTNVAGGIVSHLTLIKSQRAVGALLGEKDGVPYFICYWTNECCN